MSKGFAQGLSSFLSTNKHNIPKSIHTNKNDMKINKQTSLCDAVTGLDLWGVLVATGVVCIIYCTLVRDIIHFICSFTYKGFSVLYFSG